MFRTSGLVALIPPALLGFLLLEPTSAVLLVVLLIVKEQIWGQFIENKLFGFSLDISPIVLLLVTHSVLFGESWA